MRDVWERRAINHAATGCTRLSAEALDCPDVTALLARVDAFIQANRVAEPVSAPVRFVRRHPLVDLRAAAVLSQQELADRAGVSKTTIVNIETGKIRPHPATVRKLAAALGVEPRELAGAKRGD